MKPANKAKGEPKPAAKTQIIENKTNDSPNKNKFVCLKL